MSDRCKICGGWPILGTHTCPPKWHCWESLNQEREDASEVFAPDAQTAAELHAEEWDDECYLLGHGDPSIEVFVVKDGADEVEKFVVYGESVPQYRAVKAKEG
jgi:hypothetical protein